MRCEAAGVVPDRSTPEDRRLEAGIYRAVIDRWSGNGQPGVIVVEDVSLAILTPRAPSAIGDATDEQARRFQALPRELRAQLGPQGYRSCSVQTPDRFSEKTIIAPAAQIHKADSHVKNVDWEKFRQRVPGASVVYAFSRALVTKDGRDALLYYERQCPGACGEGEHVWLHRARLDAPWIIVAELVSWVS